MLRDLGRLGAALAAAPLVGQAIPRRAAAQRIPSRIAFVRTADRASGVRQALGLFDPRDLPGRRLLLKPNLNSADPSPGSTHPETLRAFATWLQEQGASEITIADRSGMGDTRQVMRQTGTLALAEELGLNLVVLDELNDPRYWSFFEPDGSHWSRGFAMTRLLEDVDRVVQTCNLKTHRFGGHFTLSLKNAVGLAAKRLNRYDYMQELHSSPFQREMIAELNLAYSPDVVLLDGVEAFVSGGPDRGEIAPTEVILAGSDRVAIDAVGVALLRLWGTTPEVSTGPIFQQAQIRRAVELGLGAAGPDQIELVTADQPSADYAARVRAILDAG
jgi:uncharacterized protein (DUF362 family)